MENFDQIFTLLANHEGISLNTDILETGLINILALLAILIYTVNLFSLYKDPQELYLWKKIKTTTIS
jgi:hypothetical protein